MDEGARQSSGGVVRLQSWVTILVGLVAIASFIGQMFVGHYRINAVETAQTAQEAKATLVEGRVGELEKFNRVMEVLRNSFESLQRAVENHIANSDLHQTPEQKKAMTAMQLQPILLQLNTLEVQMRERDRQVDKLLAMVETLVQETRSLRVQVESFKVGRGVGPLAPPDPK